MLNQCHRCSSQQNSLENNSIEFQAVPRRATAIHTFGCLCAASTWNACAEVTILFSKEFSRCYRPHLKFYVDFCADLLYDQNIDVEEIVLRSFAEDEILGNVKYGKYICLTKFLSLKELLQLIPYSKSQILRLEKAGRFPERVKLGPGRVAWPASAIEAWMESKMGGAQ